MEDTDALTYGNLIQPPMWLQIPQQGNVAEDLRELTTRKGTVVVSSHSVPLQGEDVMGTKWMKFVSN